MEVADELVHHGREVRLVAGPQVVRHDELRFSAAIVRPRGRGSATRARSHFTLQARTISACSAGSTAATNSSGRLPGDCRIATLAFVPCAIELCVSLPPTRRLVFPRRRRASRERRGARTSRSCSRRSRVDLRRLATRVPAGIPRAAVTTRNCSSESRSGQRSASRSSMSVCNRPADPAR